MKRSRNPIIDLMRFVFIICVVLHHAILFRPRIMAGYIGVEFFFIVSGWLMMKKLAAYTGEIDVGTYTFQFIKHKLSAFYIELLVSSIFGLIAMQVFNWQGMKALGAAFVYLMGDFALLQIWGFPVYSATGVVWFLSAMVSAALIMVPLALKLEKIFNYVLAPVLVLCISGTFISQIGYIGVVLEPAMGGWIHWGLLRAIADMSLGCIAYEGTMAIRKMKVNEKYSLLLHFIEIGGYLGTLTIAIIEPDSSKGDFIMVFLLGVSVMVSFATTGSEISYRLALLFNNLGKFSLFIFLNHFYIAHVLSLYVSQFSTKQLDIIYAIAILVLSLLALFVSRKIRGKVFKIL